MATDDPAYRAPTPRRFYVHDDLTDDVRSQLGPESPAFLLALELLDLVRRSPGQVEVLTLEDQVQALLSRGRHLPFAVAAAIGAAGERVAGHLHTRTGWFPHIRRLDITRVEDGHGGYFVASTTSTPLEAQLGVCPRNNVLSDMRHYWSVKMLITPRQSPDYCKQVIAWRFSSPGTNPRTDS